MVPQCREGIANAISQKDEKLHTAGLDDTAKPHIKKKTNQNTASKKTLFHNNYLILLTHMPPSRKNRQIKQNKIVISCLSILV